MPRFRLQVEVNAPSKSAAVRLLNRVNPEMVTDRALRYRANADPPPGEERCCLCGTHLGQIDIGHVDGHEENSNPSNLFWTCRSCNVRSANTLRAAGMGRLTRQYNPAEGAKNLGEWMQAVAAIKGVESSMSTHQAVQVIHATPASRRSKFAKDIWRLRKAHGTDKVVPF